MTEINLHGNSLALHIGSSWYVNGMAKISAEPRRTIHLTARTRGCRFLPDPEEENIHEEKVTCRY